AAALDGGRLGTAARAAWRPRPLQAAAGTRQAPGRTSSRRSLYARRRPAYAHGGRACVPPVRRGGGQDEEAVAGGADPEFCLDRCIERGRLEHEERRNLQARD